MNLTYRNLIADYGSSLITHIGLVDATGTELTGGAPAYARLAVTWELAVDGRIKPTAHLTFDIPADTYVDGWRGYSEVVGGTDYGGAKLEQVYTAIQTTYELNKDRTSVDHLPK